MNPPHGARLENLRGPWPIFLSYILSYIHVSTILSSGEGVVGVQSPANLDLLFWLSLVPFATASMGENGFAPAAWSLVQAVIE